MKIRKGIEISAFRLLLFGRPGTRKSTCASLAPKPLFIDIENGIKQINADKLPHCKSYDDFLKALNFCRTQNEYKTFVIDGLETLETLMFEYVIDRGIMSRKDALAFGKGFAACGRLWKDLFNWMDEQVERGINVILVGHSDVVNESNAESSDYVVETLKVNRKNADLIIAHCDASLLCRVSTRVVKTDNKKKVNGGESYEIVVGGNPAIKAKNRYRKSGVGSMENLPNFYQEMMNFKGKGE